MSTVQCSHCEGTGRVLARLSLTTGEAEYRTCSVCNGTGSVPAEKRYFTEYPDRSLQNALGLMQALGKPVEICIGDSDVHMLFRDGSRYVFGGFTVGYRGTGPDYTKRLLDAANFSVSMDEIAEMEPPVTLVAGEPYIPPKIHVFQAPTLEEARKAAAESVPSDARIISLEVVCNGATLIAVKGIGVSEDAAYEAAKECLPEGAVIEGREVQDDFQTLSVHGLTEEDALRSVSKEAVIEKKEVFENLDTGGFKPYQGEGDSEDAAFQEAKRLLPTGAVIVKKEILRAGSPGRLTVQAISQWEAERQARSQLPQGAVLKSTHCTQQPHLNEGYLRGLLLLLGVVKDKLGTYDVAWLLPWRVQLAIRRIHVRLTLRQRRVTLTYRPQPAIKVRFQLPSKEG